VMTADGATLAGDKLTLTGVATNSIIFADRPVRAAMPDLDTLSKREAQSPSRPRTRVRGPSEYLLSPSPGREKLRAWKMVSVLSVAFMRSAALAVVVRAKQPNNELHQAERTAHRGIGRGASPMNRGWQMRCSVRPRRR
jgi:hypothetical protein